MKNLRFFLIILGIVAISLAMANGLDPQGDATAGKNAEVPVSQSLVDDTPFDKMMAVLTHQRCLNCHPADDRPRQGEDSHIHNFEVRRGPDNHGVAALKCQSCHQDENNDFSGVPGAPEWSLAPIEMAWAGLSRVEIARSMLNPENNGGRTLEETVKHLTEHELVLWAWEPGMDVAGNPREKPPVSKEEYIKAVKEWAAGGAVIPEE
jgi:hypothetical protein